LRWNPLISELLLLFFKYQFRLSKLVSSTKLSEVTPNVVRGYWEVKRAKVVPTIVRGGCPETVWVPPQWDSAASYCPPLPPSYWSPPPPLPLYLPSPHLNCSPTSRWYLLREIKPINYFAKPSFLPFLHCKTTNSRTSGPGLL
jgi:hypothetical protein